MKARAARLGARLWDRPRGGWEALRHLLTPAAALYGGSVAMRSFAYRAGLFAARRAPARTVSIGNLRIGGTGKTPLTRWLAETLHDHGVAVAIVSRGYGGTLREPHVVGDGLSVVSDVTRSGDEAVMLARTASVPVVAGRDRFAAAAFAVREFKSRLLLCDDAFQHRRLQRDLDVVLIDAEETGGVGRLLPAGPLREPLSALARADVIVVCERGDTIERIDAGNTPRDRDDDPTAPDDSASETAPRATRAAGAAARPPSAPARGRNVEAVLRDARRRAGWREQLVVRARFLPTALVEAGEAGWRMLPLGALARQRVVVVSGVARPASLYTAIREWEGEIVQVLEYPDHYPYGTREWKEIAHLARDADLVVTTEKDLVKLERFPFARGKLVAVRLGVAVDEASALIARVAGSEPPIAGLARVASDTDSRGDG